MDRAWVLMSTGIVWQQQIFMSAQDMNSTPQFHSSASSGDVHPYPGFGAQLYSGALLRPHGLRLVARQYRLPAEWCFLVYGGQPIGDGSAVIASDTIC